MSVSRPAGGPGTAAIPELEREKEDCLEARLVYTARPYLRITRNRMWSQHLRGRRISEFESSLAYTANSKTKIVKNFCFVQNFVLFSQGLAETLAGEH